MRSAFLSTGICNGLRKLFAAIGLLYCLCLTDIKRELAVFAVRFLLVHRDKLSEEDRMTVSVMPGFSDLHKANALKESSYPFMSSPNSTVAAQKLHDWLEVERLLAIPEFRVCSRMLRNWKPYILNAFDFTYSNGFTEGCNSAIKTLKRVAFVFRNFYSFKARILLTTNRYPYI